MKMKADNKDALIAEMKEVLSRLMTRKEVTENLHFLHRGIGTATETAVFLDLEKLFNKLNNA
jgi:hypothetical protein